MNIKEAVNHLSDLVQSPGCSQKTADALAVVLTDLRSEAGMKACAAEVVANSGALPEEEQDPRSKPIGFFSYQDLEKRLCFSVEENKRLNSALTQTVQKLKRTETALRSAEEAIDELRERNKNQFESLERSAKELREQRRMLTEQDILKKAENRLGPQPASDPHRTPSWLKDPEPETPPANLFTRRDQIGRLVDAWLQVQGVPLNSFNVVTALSVLNLLK